MDPRVRELYKKMLWIGRDYPQGLAYFRERLKSGFLKNKTVEGEEVNKALARGEFIYKEIEALIFLTRYREMKRRYYSDD